MDSGTNGERPPKVFIFQAEYGYEVSPSPVVVPRRGATLYFRNLCDFPVRVFIPDKDPILKIDLPANGDPQPVTLPDNTSRVVLYRVEMGNGLFARGNSAPIIIRDP